MSKDDDAIDSEVDHSFFDSDYEEKQDIEEKKKEKETLGERQQIHDESISESSLKNTETRDDKESDLSDVSTSEANRLSDDDDCTEVQEASEKRKEQLKEKLSRDDWQGHRSANTSPAVSIDKSEEDVSEGSLTYVVSSKRRTSVLTQRVKKDGVRQHRCDTDTSEDEQDKTRLRPKSAKYHNSYPRSSKPKHITYSSSCRSVSDSSDTESDSYSSESPYSSSRADDLDSSFSSPEHKSKLSLSGAGKQNNKDYVDESEDTVTDVTPLSTPDMSPIQSFDLSASNDTSKQKKIKRQENVSQDVYDDFTEEQEKSASNIEKGRSQIPSSRSGAALSDTLSLDSGCDRRHTQKVLDDAVDLNHLLKAFMHIEKREPRNVIVDYPTPAPRKNYSFSNDEVRRLDHENQRLLKELSRQMSKSKTKSTVQKKPAVSSTRLYHTAVNRQKEQQRIERENLALLKRLESVKPTAGMKRSEQLLDYQRQVGYLGSAQPLLKQNRSSGSKMPSEKKFQSAQCQQL